MKKPCVPGLGAIALLLATVGGCHVESDSSGDGQAGASSNNDGTGGKGTAIAAAGTSGSNGEAASCFTIECPEVAQCGPDPLAPYCALEHSDCPTTQQDIVDRGMCRFASGAQQYDTACGEHVVEAGFGTHAMAWAFDSSGALTYLFSESDTMGPCEGVLALSRVRKWGKEPCERVGEIKPFACSAATGAGGARG